MPKKKERGNGDGDVWPRKNREGKVIGYRASYWVETARGPRRRYVSGKAKAGREDGFFSDAGATTLGEYLDGWLEDTAAPCASGRR